jgi:polyvinyl alcohol dehydrogenase (cytochrome)
MSASVPLRLLLCLFLLTFTAGYSCERPEAKTGEGVWRFWGGNLHNTHHAENERTITADNVHRLRPKWTFETTGSVSAIPTLSETQLYFTDWGSPLRPDVFPPGGRLYAVDRQSGAEVWSRSITSYSPHQIYNLSRSSPAIAGDLLIFGDWMNAPAELLFGVLGLNPGPSGTSLYAVRRSTGELVWKTVLESHPLSMVTQSPVVHDGTVYVGVSSKESGVAKAPYPCCNFRGSFLAVDLATGAIKWQRYLVPDNGGRPGGFSGGAVWGSSPSIDTERGVVYITTGQNYDVPAPLKDCMRLHKGEPEVQQRECVEKLDPPDNLHNAVVALDLDDGEVRWAKKLWNYDAWNFACDPRIVPWIPPFPGNCPDPEGEDFDFGQSPMLYTAKVNGRPRDLVAVGQKSGIFWAFDPDRGGEVVWRTRVGPGGKQGGMEFGAATDGQRIYTQITNFEHTEFELTAGTQKGRKVNGGIWAALDAATGELLWQTPDPSSVLPLKGTLVHPIYGAGLGEGFFAMAMGPMTVANGVVFAGSMDQRGHFYAFDAATGQIRWSFASGGSSMSAPSVANGVLYWGSGYPVGSNNNKLYAFELGPE